MNLKIAVINFFISLTLIAQENPLLYLNFDHSGLPAGTSIVGGSPEIVAGWEGDGVRLTGSSAYSSDIFIDQLSGGTTWTTWIKPTLYTEERRQLICIDNGGYDWTIGVENGEWYIYPGGYPQPTGFSAELNEWQFVYAQFDPVKGHVLFGKNDTYKIFRPVIIPESHFPLGIGYNPGFGQYFEGILDEVRIYDRILTIPELKILSSQATPLRQISTKEGAYRVLWVRVSFPDTELKFEGGLGEIDTIMASVTEHVQRASFGKTYFEWDISPEIHAMPQTATYYGGNITSGIRSKELTVDAMVAVAHLYPLEEYDLVGVIMGLITETAFPDTAWRSGGGDAGSICDQDGCLPFNLIRSVNIPTIAHELGHNLGIGHPSLWVPDVGQPPDGQGHPLVYGYPFDVMGGRDNTLGGWPEFNPASKYFLGYIEQSHAEFVIDSGTYTLRPFDEGQPFGTMTLILPEESGIRYHLGFRNDYEINPESLFGVEILRVDELDSANPAIIDTTPGSARGSLDSPLTLGKTFSFSQIPYHLTPIRRWEDSQGAAMDVYVHRDDGSPNIPPTALLELPLQARARELNSYRLNASDSDDRILSVFWDFGRSHFVTDSKLVATRHAYLTGGEKSIKLTVSDRRGGSVHLTESINIEEPLSNGWTQAIAPNGGQRWMDVECLDGSFFAVGDKIGVSTDGYEWSLIPLDISQSHLETLSFGQNRFVAVGVHYNGSGFNGITAYSNDGITWSYNIHYDYPPLKAVAYGSDGFVAVGDSGIILHSSDGINWTVVSAANSGLPSFLGLVYDPDFGFVAGGQADQLYISSDGLNWAPRPAETGWYMGDLKASPYGIHISATASLGLMSRDGKTHWNSVFGEGWLADLCVSGEFVFALRLEDEPGLWVTRNGLYWESVNCQFAGTPTGVAAKGNTLVVANFDGSLQVVEHRVAQEQADKKINYNTWHLQFPWSQRQLSSDALDDPDGDSLVNLAEYFLALDPTIADYKADRDGLIIRQDEANPQRFVIQYQRRRYIEEEPPILQLSPNLMNWSKTTMEDQTITPKNEYIEQVKGTVDMIENKAFFRLQLQQ